MDQTQQYMRYKYGTKCCKNALLYLSSDDSLKNRLSLAFYEVWIIVSGDVSGVHLTEIQDWGNKYREIVGNRKDRHQKNDADLEKLARKLVWICTEIIQYNSKNIRNINTQAGCLFHE